MESPRRQQRMRRAYSEEEKKQLIANLDLEVEHRTRQMEETLAQALENFMNHHEGQVLRIPKLVRGITMGEFADKYDGDISACLRGLQRSVQGGEPTMDANQKKRKWKDLDDVPGPEDAESSRAAKAARIMSPVKMSAAKVIKARLNKTPGTNRIFRQLNTPRGHALSPSKSSRPLSRFMTPTKASVQRQRVPSGKDVPTAKEFNPSLPKAPSYPRLPRKNESLMSINGSPLVFPSQSLHNDIPDTIEEDDEESGPEAQHTLKRQTSIVIRKDNRSRSPSRATHTHSSSGSSSSIPSLDSLPPFKPSAFMRVPTKDGLILEFDPLLTTPDELDALDGITDSAKKKAREDMTHLVQAALSKWRI